MWKIIHKEMKMLGDPKRAKASLRFFKSEKGSYAYGDVFIGLTVPQIRRLAKKYSHATDFTLIQLLASPLHESRLLALVILSERSKKHLNTNDQRKLADTFHFFSKNINRVNNWDLVDVSAPWIVGGYLANKNDIIRKQWLKSKSMWLRRISIVSLLHEVRLGKLGRVFRDAPKLIEDPEDLIHKALGWVLREAGKKDPQKLRDFLKKYGHRMPRTALRYSIEKFSATERRRWLHVTSSR